MFPYYSNAAGVTSIVISLCKALFSLIVLTCLNSNLTYKYSSRHIHEYHFGEK